MDVMSLTDEQLEQLTGEQIAEMNAVQLTQLKMRLAGLSHQLKATHAHYKLWASLPDGEATTAEKNASKTLTKREDWLMWDCYHNRRNPLPELTHEEFSEVFMLLKQPFSLIRERLSELMSTKHWPLQWSLVLYDISGMTFPVSREDGKLVSEIMSHQREHYETRVKPYEGLPSQWDDEFDYDDEADDRSWLEKAKCRVRWEFSKLISHFRKPWPPPGIEQQLSGRIYEQSSDALLQLRFTWGRNGSPELDFVPMKPLEHFRFGFNGEFICYSWYHPSTGGGYPWCELIPILENPTGNDADWRFKDGYVFEYCLKDESKDSPDASIVLNSDEE